MCQRPRPELKVTVFDCINSYDIQSPMFFGSSAGHVLLTFKHTFRRSTDILP